MLKKVSFLFFIFLSILFYQQYSFANNNNIFENYKNNFIKHGGFPINTNDEVQKILISAPYDNVYIYANSQEFLRLVDPDKRNKIDSIITTGIIIHKKKESDGSLRGNLKNKVFIPKITLFTGKTTLRGGLSLNCGKPSFKIKNDNMDFTYKLKGFCGANYGIEEKLFGDLIENMGNSLLNNYYVFFKPQYYRKVFINGKLYGLYIEVPAFNKQYLYDNNVIIPKKKQNCIIKAGRFIIPSTAPKSTITSRMEYTQKKVADKDINFVFETKYGNEKVCLKKKKNLLNTINKKNVKFKEISNLVNTESILMWGLILRNTNNHISFTHNYLLVENNGKFSAGFRDIENFQGCRKQPIERYFDKDNWQYNLLFSKILKRYLKNNPQKIKDFEKKISDKICNYNSYLKFKNSNLKYVIADRFIWGLGNITPIDNINDKKMLKYDLIKIYKRKLDFQNYFKKQYSLFDKYFGFK